MPITSLPAHFLLSFLSRRGLEKLASPCKEAASCQSRNGCSGHHSFALFAKERHRNRIFAHTEWKFSIPRASLAAREKPRKQMAQFSGAVKLADLNDFIAPSQACVVNIHGQKKNGLQLDIAELDSREEVRLRACIGTSLQTSWTTAQFHRDSNA